MGVRLTTGVNKTANYRITGRRQVLGDRPGGVGPSVRVTAHGKGGPLFFSEHPLGSIVFPTWSPRLRVLHRRVDLQKCFLGTTVERGAPSFATSSSPRVSMGAQQTPCLQTHPLRKKKEKLAFLPTSVVYHPIQRPSFSFFFTADHTGHKTLLSLSTQPRLKMISFGLLTGEIDAG